MTTSFRPVFQNQGPASNCTLDGHELGWKSCTAYSMAMGVDVATAGRHRPSGCRVRALTGDTVGGLMLHQVAEVAQEAFDVLVTVRSGSHAISPDSAWNQIALGRGFVLQGNAIALIGTRSQSTHGPANHAVWVNEVRGGTPDVPAEALVFDPAADGRADGFARGPRWWPWSRVLDFAAALRPNGGDGPPLGPGRFYAGFIPRPDVQAAAVHVHDQPEPDVTLRFKAARTTPFPDRTRTDPPPTRRVNLRSRPDRLQASDIVDRWPDGALFIAYQRTVFGTRPPGSASGTWFGDRHGRVWIHESGLRHIGGAS